MSKVMTIQCLSLNSHQGHHNNELIYEYFNSDIKHCSFTILILIWVISVTILNILALITTNSEGSDKTVLQEQSDEETV